MFFVGASAESENGTLAEIDDDRDINAMGEMLFHVQDVSATPAASLSIIRSVESGLCIHQHPPIQGKELQLFLAAGCSEHTGAQPFLHSYFTVALRQTIGSIVMSKISLTEPRRPPSADTSLKLSSYPVGRLLILVGGAWRPVCGRRFWDNEYGADAACRAMGYSSGRISRNPYEYVDEPAVWVGRCKPHQLPGSCSDDWHIHCGRNSVGGCSCKAGDSVAFDVHCDDKPPIPASALASVTNVRPSVYTSDQPLGPSGRFCLKSDVLYWRGSSSGGPYVKQLGSQHRRPSDTTVHAAVPYANFDRLDVVLGAVDPQDSVYPNGGPQNMLAHMSTHTSM